MKKKIKEQEKERGKESEEVNGCNKKKMIINR